MDNVVSINPKKSEPHPDNEYTVLVKYGHPVTHIQQASTFGLFDSFEMAQEFINTFPLIQDQNYICEIIPFNRIDINNGN